MKSHQFSCGDFVFHSKSSWTPCESTQPACTNFFFFLLHRFRQRELDAKKHKSGCIQQLLEDETGLRDLSEDQDEAEYL